MTQKKKSHLEWSWIIMIAFITLSIVDIRFGLFGFACMTIPLIHALRGRGKIHCSHYCPRGSLLTKFLTHLSLKLTPPAWFKSKWTKHVLLTLMATMLTIALVHAHGDPTKIAFAVFRLMTASLLVGILMGYLYQPRTWCQVCPMGHATQLIHLQVKKQKMESNAA